jgi:hypothetical protein
LLLTLNTSRPSSAHEAFHVSASEADGLLVQPWRTLRPDPAFHGQWLVAGDLTGDSRAEIVTARNDRQRVTAVVATRLDGHTLWKWGSPDAGSPRLNYDVPLQIYDLDGDGRSEVWLSTENHILVLDGATGQERRRLHLPDGLEVADCITFANLRGTERPTDVIIKSRYDHIWARTDQWEPLWEWAPSDQKTCHHPTPIDIDRDGRDEIMAGYSLLDEKGRGLWKLDLPQVDLSRGHLDCCEVFRPGRRQGDFRLLVTCCGAHALAMIDGAGKPVWEVTGHHFESVDAAEIRPDVPGREVLVDIDHQPYGQGPVWLLSEAGEHLGTFVCGYGRHHRLIDWDGDGLSEILIGNARRLFDGRGRCVARFGPAGAFDDESGPQKDGDPGPFAAIGDLDGDQRPEIILHSSTTVRIYRSERATLLTGRSPGTGPNFTLY